MSKKQKRMLFRVLASAVLFAVALLLPTEGWLRLFTFLIPYAVIAWDVLWRAVRNIAHGQVFDENFLMSLATVGALATGEYPEAVFVMLFYQVGELFQSYAVDQSRKSITSLMDIRPDYANIEVDGQLRQVDPEDVAVGDTIVIKAGERIPLDGVVLEGTSNVDTAALTGESLPREAQPGDDVISGCVNLSGLLRVRVTKAFEESTVAKILDLVENSSSKKAKAENFITKFARYYTPAVVLAAALVDHFLDLQVDGLAGLLDEDLIVLDYQGRDKDQVLRFMAEGLERKGYVTEQFLEDVMARESRGSTALGFGVAIPHGVSGYVNRPAVSVVRLEESMDWAGEPVSLIFMLALNFKDIESTRAFFNGFYHLTCEVKIVELLRGVTSPGELIRVISEQCV